MPNTISTICVVDDDPDIRESLRIFIEDEGYEVVEAEDGLTALDVLRASPTGKVVLLDLMMPRLDGVGVLRRVEAEPGALGRHAYIIITANRNTLSADARAVIERLHVPIVTKPFDLARVREAVERAADRLA
jgi:CheY-like chemotaxis protein